MSVSQKQLKVRAGKVAGLDALSLARKRAAPEGLEAEYEVARAWYQALLEKGRKQKQRVRRANRPAATTAKLDKLCGDIVRARGVCEAAGWDEAKEASPGLRGVVAAMKPNVARLNLVPAPSGVLACTTHLPLQWAHGESRRFFRSRWEPDTHSCLCAGHHALWSHHDVLGWWVFLMSRFPDRFALLMALREFEVPKGAARVEWLREIEADLRGRTA